ncbi:methyl-accepting chemotaxis sensory transducer with Cache sensor [Trinickia symbiotica]|uniref:Methyl-accepting chemotaxis protein n=1 Tax=Trinickia symbiotica TaxID=863227 RepID=A0A2N7X4X6_9BURK|nr:methyl-accepting chemotaxis protein [Trinickia symbiotica]PMS36809.1 methyl-accepting chemotaxis protein [Trinickia symbiotica]PPK46262.1 methyl-accepting chemotaxis sensory transducer with Cache sensor [Trinickia symbiotica]
MQFWRKLSIQNKLVVSMASCLLVFVAISSGLSVCLISGAVRDRVIQEELPSAVNGIRADVQRQMAGPIAAVRTLARDAFLLQWEADGEPDASARNWIQLARNVKDEQKATSVGWASVKSGNYYNEAGLQQKLTDKDQWLPRFLSSRKPFEVNMDHEGTVDLMFINSRVELNGTPIGAASIAFSAEELAKAIKGYGIGETGLAYLVRSDGTIIMHRETSLMDGKHFLKDERGLPHDVSSVLLAGKPYAYLCYVGDRGSRFIATSFVPELDSYVVVEVPQAELLGPVTRAILSATLVAAVAGLSVSLIVIWLVGRAVSSPIRRAAMLLSEIASGQGDLTRRMTVDSQDEIGQLSEAFNRFVSSLSRLVHRIRAASAAIATGATQIASGNADLSQRTEEQSSNLERTASSMEQITAVVRNNTERATTAAESIGGASDAAARGGQIVGDVVSTMEQISAASQRISEIIAMMDSISFQTNILALNAAVEAARAGEQGRGFAVVATEVRNLAQRSAQAAKEIKALIEHSAGTVSAGSLLVSQAGKVMGDVVAQVQGVSAMMREIAEASLEQSAGIDQIQCAVQSLDQTTQQNAALVEESAAAADSLKQQAAELTRLVSAFKVDDRV